MNVNRRTVVIAAEEPIVRYGFRRLFEAEPDFAIAGEAADGPETLKMVFDVRPGVLLLELAVPLSALVVISRMAASKSTVRTLLLASPGDRSQIAEAFKLGVRGVVYKGLPTHILLQGARAVIAGQYWIGEKPIESAPAMIRDFAEHHRDGRKSWQVYGLTPRERQIVAMITTGCSNKDAGRRFSISERTVKHHLSNIYEKIGVSSRFELALFAINHHLDLSEPHGGRSSAMAEMNYAEIA
jgi:two-component system, NarL family, nitrate/nitrite response regulator NarL